MILTISREPILNFVVVLKFNFSIMNVPIYISTAILQDIYINMRIGCYTIYVDEWY